LFMVQNTPPSNEISWGGLDVAELDYTYRMSKFDLTLHVYEKGETVELDFEYCTDLFAASTIERMKAHYENLLIALVAQPEQPISQLRMLSAPEEYQLLSAFNGPQVDTPAAKTIVQLVEEQVLQTPDREAVHFQGQALTYEQLNRKANQVAHRLREVGVRERALVGVYTNRSLEMIIGLLGILKAGAAYVPIDPGYPEQRITYMLEESEAKVVISNQHLAPALSDKKTLTVLVLDSAWAGFESYSEEKCPVEARPEDPTYIIYTSGSTGRPKGVEMPTRALVNLLLWQQDAFESESVRTVLQFTSLSFDVSFQEIFSALCFGNKLVLIDEDQRRDTRQLLQVIERQAVTHLFMPFIVLDTLAEAACESEIFPQSLEEVITAGEQLKLTQAIQQFIQRTSSKLVNQYGPSESHVVSAYAVTPEDYSTNTLPPIGKPIRNTQLFVLDAHHQLCGLGITGELYIGGLALAKGYFNRIDLTKEKFVTISLAGTPQHVYKTGDLVKWLPDGNLQYIGRVDDQVKIRGHRVELGEIENVIQQCQGVLQNAVLTREDAYGTKYLIAYVVKEDAFPVASIKAALGEQLPDYMIPAVFVSLDYLPITINGKINKHALPDPKIDDSQATKYVAPQTETERKLAAIWMRLLTRDQVGGDDNFFELGGHSLLVTRLIAKVRKELAVELATRDVFLHPTVAKLATAIDAMGGAVQQPGITRVDRPVHIPLSYAQERLWFVDKIQGSAHYHIWSVWRVQGELREEWLEEALKQVVARHEVLRTVIEEDLGQAFQRVRAYEDWRLERSVVDAGGEQERFLPLVRAEIQKPFDLSADFPFRARLIKVAADQCVLVLVCHHIATDGWSEPIFMREIGELYAALEEERVPTLSPLPIQYADYALWQRKYGQGSSFVARLAYWEHKLRGLEPLSLPFDYKRTQDLGVAGKLMETEVEAAVSNQLRALAKQEGATTFMALLSAFYVVLYRYTGKEDLCIGVPVSNRMHAELEPLIGFFINNLPVRCEVSGHSTFAALLAQVKTAVLEAFDH
ncbi:MAG TPA: amino acid adenylation domain-containing protein, partial [Hymenobacter sp.]|nr:amino acid adenylation domain-containing protein [Hymenobacter sp.]